ncbi:aromatic ring-hydroxylating dioxygenase subunit alpha [Sphingobium sp.]|uniref:aromatic ring-hydroxylating dioxygenase subunit alpha n=1 Tax=Sphingobium sp. TaxID=1912891 RepID=UPI0028BEC19E|nr:aromatic ring-hydroxylating dioxygenase subunit alpha [Sphingobium sp.]
MGQRVDIADHRTPLIRNAWYVAAFSEELGNGDVVSRVILGTRTVLYRKEDGSIAAMDDRCPHRSLPFSKGRREGDTLVCGYHGMTFDSDGRCVRIPSQSAVPSSVRVRTYPVIERRPFVWIWTGDTESADTSLLPDIPWFDDPGYEHISGYMHSGCNYARLHENLLDLTHVPFVHDGGFGAQDFDQVDYRHYRDGSRVGVVVREDDVDPSIMPGVFDPDHRVSRVTDWYCHVPSVNIGLVTAQDEVLPPGERVAHTTLIHALTPSSRTGTHYFWVVSMDTNLGNRELQEAMRSQFGVIFGQDKTLLEKVEEVWAENEDFREISVGADKSGILVRRILADMAEAEQQRASEEPLGGADAHKQEAETLA